MPTKTPSTKWAIEEIIEKLRNAGLPEVLEVHQDFDVFEFYWADYNLVICRDSRLIIQESSINNRLKNLLPETKDLDVAIAKLQELIFSEANE